MKKTKKKNQIDIVAKASESVLQKVEDELLIEDPSDQKASAIINESMKGCDESEKTRSDFGNSVSDNQENSETAEK